MPFVKTRISLTILLGGLTAGCSTLAPQSDVYVLQQPEVKIYPLTAAEAEQQDPVYQLMVAELAVNSGQNELAVSNYLSLAMNLDDPVIAERAVRVAVYGQDLNAAQMAAERWIELEPDRLEARQIISAIFIRLDDDEQAFKYLKQVIDSHKQINDQIFISLLGVLAREKNTDTVLRVSKRIADNYCGYAYAHYLHGSLASRSNLAEESLEYLDNALEIKDIPEAYPIRAKMLIQLGKQQQALVSLKHAVMLQPNNKQLRLALARLLVDVKEYEKARSEFEKLLLLAPDDADLLYTLGLLSLESQRFDDAEKYLTKLLQTGQRKGEAQYYLGRIYESRSQYEQAIDWYGRVQNGEYRFDAQIRSANLLATLGQTDLAIEQLKKMANNSQSKASLVRIYLAKGEVLNQAERHHAAIEIYDQALLIIPGNIDLLYARGLTGEKIGNLQMLEDDMKTILQTEPDNAHALNALGFTLADQTDRIEEAYGYLKKAIEILPDDPAIIDSYGWVNYRLGNYEEAIRLLRKALTQFEDGEIAAHLGEVLWVTGRQQEALNVWNKALEKSPEDPYVLETMNRLNPR